MHQKFRQHACQEWDLSEILLEPVRVKRSWFCSTKYLYAVVNGSLSASFNKKYREAPCRAVLTKHDTDANKTRFHSGLYS